MFCSLAVGAALLVADPTSKADDAAVKALAALNGSWEVVRFEKAGREDKVDEKQQVLVIQDGKLTGMFPDKQVVGLTVDPTKTPTALTMSVPTNDRGGPAVMPGVYELNGDTLKICVNTEFMGSRPENFRTEKSLNILYVLKKVREKEEKP